MTDVAQNIQWNLGVGSSYFMEIAKERLPAYFFPTCFPPSTDENPKPVYIHSVTTDWNKTVYDAHVNMLRLTAEAMAAVLGDATPCS